MAVCECKVGWMKRPSSTGKDIEKRSLVQVQPSLLALRTLADLIF
jgi:hypothetical protein